jgi:hypothetical protein
MIPKSCRLFGPDHATEQLLGMILKSCRLFGQREAAPGIEGVKDPVKAAKK